MSAGRHKFTYLARASTAGHFIALPTQAWGMYDEVLWGRSASSEFSVLDTSIDPLGVNRVRTVDEQEIRQIFLDILDSKVGVTEH